MKEGSEAGGSSRRRSRFVVLTLLFLVVLLAVALWSSLKLRSPSYRGRSLQYWLQTYKDSDTADNNAVTNAVRSAGTNAIPVLLRMVAQAERGLRPGLARTIQWWCMAHLSGPKWVPASIRMPFGDPRKARFTRSQAVVGFRILGPEAYHAGPTLLQMYQHAPIQVKSDIFKALAVADPAGELFMPLILRDATNADPMLRMESAIRLDNLHCEPMFAARLYASFLGDQEGPLAEVFRSHALLQLGYMGPRAEEVIPQILPLLGHTNQTVRSDAAKALMQIDDTQKQHLEAWVRSGARL